MGSPWLVEDHGGPPRRKATVAFYATDRYGFRSGLPVVLLHEAELKLGTAPRHRTDGYTQVGEHATAVVEIVEGRGSFEQTERLQNVGLQGTDGLVQWQFRLKRHPGPTVANDPSGAPTASHDSRPLMIAVALSAKRATLNRFGPPRIGHLTRLAVCGRGGT